MPIDLTIAIPTLNEEKNLATCLNRIGKDLAKRIVVIDSGSTDDTIKIAKEFGAEVIDFRWDGKYPKKRNWYLRNGNPGTKWILFLDADEYLTDEFKKELRAAVTSDSKDGYWLSYSIYFMNKKLKGGYPLKKLALFKVGAGEYEEIAENNWSNLDMEIHEHPQLKGEVGEFKSFIDHHDIRSISHFMQKHDQYASWEARRFMEMNNNLQAKSQWTWKQRIKYSLMGSIWIGPVFFIGSYIFLGGFRDGSRGLAFAIMKMNYFNQIYCRIRELNNC